MGNFKFKKIKDEPIGKLVRPKKLYKGYIFPNEIKFNQNFSSWFTPNIKLQCKLQTTREAQITYKNFSKSHTKDIVKQFKELNLRDEIDENQILDGYVAEITGFIYYYKGEYHLCKSKKEEIAMIKKSKKIANFNISFLVVKLFNSADLKKEKGLNEWSYHSIESFELIYQTKEVVDLKYILEMKAVVPGTALKTSKQTYIVLLNERKPKLNIIFNSLSLNKLYCLGQNKLKYIKADIFYSIEY